MGNVVLQQDHESSQTVSPHACFRKVNNIGREEQIWHFVEYHGKEPKTYTKMSVQRQQEAEE